MSKVWKFQHCWKRGQTILVMLNIMVKVGKIIEF